MTRTLLIWPSGRQRKNCYWNERTQAWHAVHKGVWYHVATLGTIERHRVQVVRDVQEE